MTKPLARTLRCAVLTAVALIAGCSTTASISTLQPIDENLVRYKKAIVVVTASPQVQSQGGFQSVETRLKFALLDKLRASKKFQDVTDQLPLEPADSDLKIVATVTGAGSRSGGTGGSSIGIGVGGFTGGGFFGLDVDTPLPGSGSNGGLIVQVEVLNAKTGKRLGYMDASATSGDAAAQAEAIAEKVVAEITSKAK